MKTYSGMVIGEHNREGDLEVNPAKVKALSNVRSVTKEEKTKLTPPRTMSLEEVIAYVRDDEIIEVTGKSIRLRKIELDGNKRKSVSGGNWRTTDIAARRAGTLCLARHTAFASVAHSSSWPVSSAH
jgi:hypothetical protein